MSDSNEVKVKWFGCHLIWDSLEFGCHLNWNSNDFGCQLIWDSIDLVVMLLTDVWFKWFLLSVDLGFKWVGCQLICDSSDLVVNWFEIQMIWMSSDLKFKWFGCQSMCASNVFGSPSKIKLWSSKTKLLCETSFKKNWSSNMKRFCETSFQNEGLWLWNCSCAQAWCKFCETQFPKVLRTHGVLTILTSKSLSRAGVVQILSTSPAADPSHHLAFRTCLCRSRETVKKTTFRAIPTRQNLSCLASAL